jgi:hypothetical protein
MEIVEEDVVPWTYVVVTLMVFVTMVWLGNVFIGFLVVIGDNPLVRRIVYGWVLFTLSFMYREMVEGFQSIV